MISAPAAVSGRRTWLTGETGVPALQNTTPSRSNDAVSVDLSVSRDVFSAVDSFFNLGKSGQLGATKGLSAAERGEVFKMVGELLKSGYVGYENLIVGRKVERHDVTMQIGDRRLRHARVYEQQYGQRR